MLMFYFSAFWANLIRLPSNSFKERRVILKTLLLNHYGVVGVGCDHVVIKWLIVNVAFKFVKFLRRLWSDRNVKIYTLVTQMIQAFISDISLFSEILLHLISCFYSQLNDVIGVVQNLSCFQVMLIIGACFILVVVILHFLQFIEIKWLLLAYLIRVSLRNLRTHIGIDMIIEIKSRLSCLKSLALFFDLGWIITLAVTVRFLFFLIVLIPIIARWLSCHF